MGLLGGDGVGGWSELGDTELDGFVEGIEKFINVITLSLSMR
jgi:hypothetical protein